MQDVLNIFLILFVIIKIVDLNNPSVLDVLIIILFIINAVLSILKRRK